MTGRGQISARRPASEEDRTAEYRKGYETLFGAFPDAVRARWDLAEANDRFAVPAALEELREAAILRSPLGLKVQQLVHFGQLVVLGKQHAAGIHAAAAIRAGASVKELLAVAETALITSGVPGYALAVEIISKLKSDEAGKREGVEEVSPPR